MRRNALVLTIISAFVSIVNYPAQAIDQNQMKQQMASGICPGRLSTVDTISYKQSCPNLDQMSAKQGLDCEKKVDDINNTIYDYNEFIRKCRDSGRRSSSNRENNKRSSVSRKYRAPGASVGSRSSFRSGNYDGNVGSGGGSASNAVPLGGDNGARDHGRCGGMPACLGHCTPEQLCAFGRSRGPSCWMNNFCQ